MPRAYEIIDVSHTIGAGTETYPGLPAPRIEIMIDHEASRSRYAARTSTRQFIVIAAARTWRRSRSRGSCTYRWS